MKLLILISFFLLSIFHGVNGGRIENDFILANDYKITFSNYNSESLPVEIIIYVSDEVFSTQDITIPAADLTYIEGLDQIPGEYDLEQAIPITSSQNFNIKTRLKGELATSALNWNLSFNVFTEHRGTWRQVFNSTRPKFFSGRFCPGAETEAESCNAVISKLGTGQWNDLKLNIRYPNGTSLLTDFRGVDDVSVRIERDSSLFFDYSPASLKKNLKSALDDALVGFTIAGEYGNFTSYHNARPSIAQIANPFKAPTGGLTSPITAEQVTEFAISIASPTYGIIEND